MTARDAVPPARPAARSGPRTVTAGAGRTPGPYGIGGRAPPRRRGIAATAETSGAPAAPGAPARHRPHPLHPLHPLSTNARPSPLQRSQYPTHGRPPSFLPRCPA
ncbi:hypothetical protein AB0D04_35130 [Streptomyces sp. NPDC048483]|uniref:hypothetical protein n=1 Tax=Streptomyces sp. NPDC048483 TaxID=3154927 RepID=UPI003439E197